MYRMTSFMTGISGFTQFSPAISIATNEEKLAYSYYRNNGYQIYNAGVDDFMPVQVSPDSVNFQAATLPPFRRAGIDLVDAGFRYRTSLPDTLIQHFTAKEYKPKFKLDYISNYGGVGMATSRYGTGMSGSIIMMFSDMVGDNQLVANLAVNGEIYDFGAQVAYLNQKHRLNWGGVVSHIPYLSGYVSMVEDSFSSHPGRRGIPTGSMCLITGTIITALLRISWPCSDICPCRRPGVSSWEPLFPGIITGLTVLIIITIITGIPSE